MQSAPNPQPPTPRAWGAFRTLADAVIAAVLAPACAVCSNVLETPLDGPVCDMCWSSIAPFTPPVCDRCGEPLPSWRTISLAAATCARCRRAPQAVDRARTIGEYAGALRAVVHALKYEGRRSLAVRLGAMMRRRGAEVLEGADLAVPVPLHRRRRLARGFNQAEDLARELGLPVRRALRRVRPTRPQIDLPESRRHANVRGAFALGRALAPGLPSARASISGRSVVLVDDVSTTGATLDACARVLKAAGAREVRALTAARAVRRRR